MTARELMIYLNTESDKWLEGLAREDYKELFYLLEELEDKGLILDFFHWGTFETDAGQTFSTWGITGETETFYIQVIIENAYLEAKEVEANEGLEWFLMEVEREDVEIYNPYKDEPDTAKMNIPYPCFKPVKGEPRVITLKEHGEVLRKFGSK